MTMTSEDVNNKTVFKKTSSSQAETVKTIYLTFFVWGAVADK